MIDFALIFDMDGVISNTADMHEEAWLKFCSNHNIEITTQLFRNTLFGRSNKETFEILLNRELPQKELSRLISKKELLYRKLAKGKLLPSHGLTNFLDKAQTFGIPIGVASSAPLINIEFTLAETKTTNYFQYITSADEVKTSKPDLEIFLCAAQKMEYAPERCLVFEDSFAGIEAAKNAGMKVVAVASTHTAEKLKGDYMIIHDFNNLSVEIISKLMRR